MEREEHEPYLAKFGRNPDFIVEYCWNPDSECKGVKRLQGMRSDFLYASDDPSVEGIHMIWPEFLDSSGEVILQRKNEVAPEGHANMWILTDENIQYHKDRLKPGSKGHMVAGSKILADLTVIQTNF